MISTNALFLPVCMIVSVTLRIWRLSWNFIQGTIGHSKTRRSATRTDVSTRARTQFQNVWVLWVRGFRQADQGFEVAAPTPALTQCEAARDDQRQFSDKHDPLLELFHDETAFAVLHAGVPD